MPVNNRLDNRRTTRLAELALALCVMLVGHMLLMTSAGAHGPDPERHAMSMASRSHATAEHGRDGDHSSSARACSAVVVLDLPQDVVRTGASNPTAGEPAYPVAPLLIESAQATHAPTDIAPDPPMRALFQVFLI